MSQDRTLRRFLLLLGVTALTLLCTSPATAGVQPSAKLFQVWSSMKTARLPSEPGDSQFRAISCVAQYECVAIGQQDDGSVGFTEWLSRGAWRRVAPPVVPVGGTAAWLDDLSCVGASFCMAVGAWGGAVFAAPLAELFDGTSWTVVPTPDPGGTDTQFESVSCTSTTFCVAVGSGLANPTQLFAEAYNGTEWTILTPITPRGSKESWLDGVSCVARSCFAVGSVAIGTNETGYDFRSLIEDYSSSRWTVVPNADPKGSLDSGLTGVSCFSVSKCVAVGSTYVAKATLPLTYSWSGAVWTRVPADAKQVGVLAHVRCRTSDECVGVGYNFNAKRSVIPDIAVFNGRVWTAARVPAVESGFLSGVGCFGFACVAVGYAGDLGTPSGPVALISSGRQAPPRFVSSPVATVRAGQAFSLVLDTTGEPTPAISATSPLPPGVSLEDGNDGAAAHLVGQVSTPGTYGFTLDATNGIGPDSVQHFALTVAKQGST